MGLPWRPCKRGVPLTCRSERFGALRWRAILSLVSRFESLNAVPGRDAISLSVHITWLTLGIIVAVNKLTVSRATNEEALFETTQFIPIRLIRDRTVHP